MLLCKHMLQMFQSAFVPERKIKILSAELKVLNSLPKCETLHDNPNIAAGLLQKLMVMTQ